MTAVPEAQLQAYVVNIARDAFAHVKPDGFKVEKRFTVRLGRGTYEHHGSADWQAEGRADLLLFHDDRPLAVVELKRADKTLKAADLKQGQSYAAMLFPRPPLVIVSNGKDTWVRAVDSGEELKDREDAAVVERLFANIGKLAAANNSWAIEVLMGPETRVWVEAVRQRTDELIARQTGSADDTRKPFAEGLLFRRRATREILDHLETGTSAVIVEGPPLAGKSSVLRDLAVTTRHSCDWAVLMVNGATSGPGLFQRLANILGTALEWKLSADDVRTWLRRMSHSLRGPALVLAVDGLRPGSATAQDLEELAETGFGPGLRIVGCIERADDILLDGTGRSEAALAAAAERVTIDVLDDDEFKDVVQELAAKRLFFYGGAELSDEYRVGWVLRLVLGKGSAPEAEDVGAVIPATLGLGLVASARERFKTLHEVSRLHRLVARDALADEEPAHPEIALAAANAFVLRRDTLSPAGERAAVQLEADGWLGFYRHSNGEDLLVFRVPALFMAELASELAATVETVLEEEPEDAWLMLVWQAQRFFLGDIIGAQALLDLGRKRRGLPAGLIEPLMNDPPSVESLAGKIIGVPMPDGTVENFRFNEDGAIAPADADGNATGEYEPLPAGEEGGSMYGNMTSWMILSQLARVRMAAGDDQRIDVDIMMWVGRAEMPLMRGDDFSNLRARASQSLGAAGSVLSSEHALAEPLTSAMHNLFHSEWRQLDFVFEQLVEANSAPLTVRVHHALNALQGSVVPGLDEWAREKMVSVVRPLLREQLALAA